MKIKININYKSIIMSYEKYIKDNQPKSVKKLSLLLAEKTEVKQRLKMLEEQEAFLKKIVPIEREIISWEYNYTKEAKEEFNDEAIKNQIANANKVIPELKQKIKTEEHLNDWRLECYRIKY